MMIIEAIAANLKLGTPWLVIPATAAVLALGYFAIRNAPLWRWTSATFITCLVVVPHVYAYNAAMLLLAVWLCYYCSASRLTRISITVFALPLLYGLRFIADAWSVAVPLTLIACLAGLALEGLRSSNAREGEVVLCVPDPVSE
jgi:hypothetical protein